MIGDECGREREDESRTLSDDSWKGYRLTMGALNGQEWENLTSVPVYPGLLQSGRLCGRTLSINHPMDLMANQTEYGDRILPAPRMRRNSGHFSPRIFNFGKGGMPEY